MRCFTIFSVALIAILVPGVGMTQIVWERSPLNVILDVGLEDDWDEGHVSHPGVVFDGSTYHLWYVGDNGSQRAIGYARSTDGMLWEEYPDNPVLMDGIGATWDGEYVSQPTVVHGGTQYRIWYTGYDGVRMRVGYATSEDGVMWERHASNPVLDVGDSGSWDAGGVSSPTVLLKGDTYHMWYAGYDGAP